MIAALILTVALGQPPGFLQVERYQWHDADTAVGAVVRLPYGVLLEGSIRAADYDAWELGNRGNRGGGPQVDDVERERGRKALEELRRISEGGSLYVVPVPPGTRDSFGRLLGRFYVRKPSGEVVDVREWAVSNGHTRTSNRLEGEKEVELREWAVDGGHVRKGGK